MYALDINEELTRLDSDLFEEAERRIEQGEDSDPLSFSSYTTQRAPEEVAAEWLRAIEGFHAIVVQIIHQLRLELGLTDRADAAYLHEYLEAQRDLKDVVPGPAAESRP